MTPRSIDDINRVLAGERFVRLIAAAHGLEVEFANGDAVTIEVRGGALVASLRRATVAVAAGRPQATRRQQEYLDFITRFMARFGVSPAESDIQRHFLVSAPSVNQMVRTLEARGLITRERDLWGYVLPRSIRVVDPS